MTMMPTIEAAEAQIAICPDAAVLPTMQLTERSWGYAIAPRDGLSVPIFIGQALAGLTGIAALIAAIGMWAIPGALVAGDVAAMKLGASVILSGLSAICLWYAGRGTLVEIEIDTNRGEIREIVRNRLGRTSVLSRHGFDAVSNVVVEDGYGAQMRLGLRLGHGGHALPVAVGKAPHMFELGARMSRDLMLMGQVRARVHTQFEPLARAAA